MTVAAGMGVAAALVLGAANAGHAQGKSNSDKANEGKNGQAINTDADYTPFEKFTPLASSTACVGEPSGRQAKPFLIPTSYDQQVVAEETDGPLAIPPGQVTNAQGLNNTEDLWDMNTQNEFGKDAGRYVYRAHEVGAAPNSGAEARALGGAQVTVTDLKTGVTKNLAERNDWERFDGIVWTPYGTILAAEETTNAAQRDPNVLQAEAGLVYELFVDPRNPDRLDPSREPIAPDDGTPGGVLSDGTTDTVKDGIRARPTLGSKSHEGMRFDKRGFHYGISESAPGGIYRFIPARPGDLGEGQLQVLRTQNGQDGEGTWVDITDQEAETNAQRAATTRGSNGYSRPEDVETGESTGVDRNNGGNTLYVALTGTDDVLAVDLSSRNRPFAYFYVNNQPRPTNPTPNATTEFDSPDNLALDSKGNLAITEDPGGTPTSTPPKTIGDDIWIAPPPRGEDDDDDEGGKRRKPAGQIQRFASLKDCVAEPTGVYFALEGTEEFSEENPTIPNGEELVNGESLFVNRQHAGQTSPVDQLVSIAPVDDDDDDGDGDDE